MKEYLTLAETSEYIGKSKETLRRWDREGKLLAVREPVSNYRVYKKSDIDNLFADFVDSDFDTEKVCVFPLPIILAESASSVAFDSFELLLEERLE